jgi:hypothetical protein
VRRPNGGFGWLEDRLLHEHWLADLGADAIAVLVLLALAADHRGASYFGRVRMADALAMDVQRIDRALGELTELLLVALRPWRSGGRDGVWQLLPIPRRDVQRSLRTLSACDILRKMGFDP